jgi:hypothetical protein
MTMLHVHFWGISEFVSLETQASICKLYSCFTKGRVERENLGTEADDMGLYAKDRCSNLSGRDTRKLNMDTDISNV